MSEHPDWGGWVAVTNCTNLIFRKEKRFRRSFEPETRAIWTNAIDSYCRFISKEYGRAVAKDTATFTGYKVTLWRGEMIFKMFAARMTWCTK